MRNSVRSLILFSVVFSLSLLADASHSPDDEGVRIDMPPDRQVRIENQFGAVDAEVWAEKYISVAAKVQESVGAFTRSPVVIENRNRRLSISIIRTAVDPAASIQLSVRIPAEAHTEIITGEGAIMFRGMPASASLRSVSGDIRAELSRPLNADISARATNGVIRSELEAPLGDNQHLLQTRMGTGERVLRINTDRGQVTLTLAKEAQGVNAGQPLAPPSLVGSETSPAGAGTPAKQSETEEVTEGDVIRVDSQLVTLNVSVIDRQTSRGLLGLTQADFSLFEDGLEQQIVQFDASSAPFDLLLVIDLSGSTRDVVKLIRAAALHFIDAARPSDRIGIVTFAGQPNLVSDLTLDREVLRQRVNAIDTPVGDTKLYAATGFALDLLSRDAKKARRSAIVLMSDGLDGSIPGVQGQLGSKLTYQELLNRTQEFDGVLYTLWLNTEYESLSPLDTQPEAFDMGRERLKEMAEVGGGVSYEVERLENLAGAYERVVADLGTVYSLAYRPTNKARDGKWRAIKVNVNRPLAVARGKRGYYAN